MFRSVLIANRGEIAVRVMRTCRHLGIRTVAVYSDADRTALHVRAADEAYRIGPPPAVASYLDQAAIVRAAREADAQAVHPGYGFLAENADFAEAVQGAGLGWIGPPPAAMRLLGEKAPAKALAQRVGVPVMPGYHGPEQAPDVLASRAQEIGFPLLIKASAGGGGRGMRVVEDADRFLDALDATKREARSSFGTDRVLLERYVRRPRHVEVQVFGDAHGNVIHLGERECSIQRRHQKLVEESPSPGVDESLRERMGAAAIALARAAGYQNAGTVEFLLDERRDFFFLELNARLQVEHPVTEMVTALDLVEWQLRVAAGEPLPLRQEDIHREGHAIEVRVIAEDPLTGFLPSSGTIRWLDLPQPRDGSVRTDTGYAAGQEVSSFYDSLLAKIVVRAPDRAAAVGRLSEALRETDVGGPKTNVALLLAIAEHDAFGRGDLHTAFLDEHQVVHALERVPPQAYAAASASMVLGASADQSGANPWRARTAWRLSGVPRLLHWATADGEVTAAVVGLPGESALEVALGEWTGRVEPLDAAHLLVGQSVARVAEGRRNSLIVRWGGRSYRLKPWSLAAANAGTRASAPLDDHPRAPMPGRVVKLHVRIGERVEAHQPLLVLEAMKMEHVVSAPGPGRVARLHVSEGAQVLGGDQLAEIESDD